MKPGALKAVRQGHPWIYLDSITQIKGRAEPGDLGVVFDRNDRLAALGLLDPESDIGLRVLTRERAKIDQAWLAEKVGEARSLRSSLASENTGMRLINGEGDGLPGLIVDRYDTVVVLKVYTLAWIRLLPWLVETLSPHFDAGVLRLSNQVQTNLERLAWAQPAKELWGSVGDGRVRFTENRLQLEANVITGHKTGHFFDQRQNRRRAAELGRGRVLDVFSCTGGFGLHAAAAGAEEVVLTDISSPSLATAKRNFAINDLPEPRTILGDAFDVLADLPPESFDLVIVDPPAFATRRSQTERAVDAYRALTRLAFRTVRPGGHLVQASCSAHVTEDRFHDTVLGVTAARSPLWVSQHDVDHPVRHVEGHYLKAIAVKKI